MQVVLVMFRADGERRSFSLPRTVTVIGRREDCDLRIPLGDVSRKHCRFIADNDTLKIEDLGSSNGTFHNGVRIQEAVVNAGDNVQVGPVMFVVQVNGVPADEEIQPPAAAPAASDDTHAPPADIEVDQLEEVNEEMPEGIEPPWKTPPSPISTPPKRKRASTSIWKRSKRFPKKTKRIIRASAKRSFSRPACGARPVANPT